MRPADIKDILQGTHSQMSELPKYTGLVSDHAPYYGLFGGDFSFAAGAIYAQRLTTAYKEGVWPLKNKISTCSSGTCIGSHRANWQWHVLQAHASACDVATQLGAVQLTVDVYGLCRPTEGKPACPPTQ